MPTHFHLVVSQREHGAVSAYLHWVTCISASNYRSETSSTGQGHVFQRRFWSEAVRDDRHFLAVLRYVEANALRSALVGRAEDWQWSSLWERLRGDRRILTPAPVPLPAEWLDLVNRSFEPQALEAIRRPRPRGRPRTRGKVGQLSGGMALPTEECASAQHY
jgi:putative transposase